MAKNKKSSKAAQNMEDAARAAAMNDMMAEAIEVVNNEELVEQVEPTESKTKKPTELTDLEAETARLKEALKAAKAKLAEEKAKAKLESARPIRRATFIAYCIQRTSDDIVIYENAETGEPFGVDSDVHYRVEKALIDQLKQNAADGHGEEWMYAIYKSNKKSGAVRLISTLYIDKETGLLVID